MLFGTADWSRTLVCLHPAILSKVIPLVESKLCLGQFGLSLTRSAQCADATEASTELANVRGEFIRSASIPHAWTIVTLSDGAGFCAESQLGSIPFLHMAIRSEAILCFPHTFKFPITDKGVR